MNEFIEFFRYNQAVNSQATKYMGAVLSDMAQWHIDNNAHNNIR